MGSYFFTFFEVFFYFQRINDDFVIETKIIKKKESDFSKWN